MGNRKNELLYSYRLWRWFENWFSGSEMVRSVNLILMEAGMMVGERKNPPYFAISNLFFSTLHAFFLAAVILPRSRLLKVSHSPISGVVSEPN